MRGAELYDHAVNRPNPEQLAVVFAVGAALIMLATLLLSLGRIRLFARVLGILGVAAIMLAMFVIHEQTIRTKFGEYITVTRSRYPQPTRFQIRVALFGLPAASALVMVWVLNSSPLNMQEWPIFRGFLQSGSVFRSSRPRFFSKSPCF